jgi:hypothetical protein
MFCGKCEGKDFGTMRKSDVKTFSSSLTGFYILPPEPRDAPGNERGWIVLRITVGTDMP